MKILKTSNLIKLQFLLCLIIVITIFTDKANLTSLCFSCTFIIDILLIIRKVFIEGIDKESNRELFLIYLITTIVFIGISWNRDINLLYFRKFIIFITSLLFLFVLCRVKVDERLIKSIIYITNVIGLSFIIAFFIFGKNEVGLLTLKFSNSNLLGMWVSHTAIYSLIGMKILNSKKSYIIGSFIFLGDLFILLKSESRTSLFVVVMFFIIYFLININFIKRVSKSVITILVMFPLIFSLIYMKILNSKFLNIFSFLEGEGKSLTSRESVWKFALKVIKEHFVFGDYYGISHGTGMSQMHNSHLDILASYGVIVFILVMYLIIKNLFKIRTNRSKISNLGIYGFLSILLIGIGEAALFSGGLGIYILSFGYLILARFEGEKRE